MVDLLSRHDSRFKRSDTNCEKVGVLLSLEYRTALSQSDLRTRKNCCIIYIYGSNGKTSHPSERSRRFCFNEQPALPEEEKGMMGN